MHLKNIFDEGELKKDSVVKKFLTTASDSKKYNVLHYNLDAIIAVGYRINSKNSKMHRHKSRAGSRKARSSNREICSTSVISI